MTEKSGGDDKNRPYAPAGNTIAVIERLRSRNLPERIDLEFLRDAGIPEGSIHRNMFALKFLGLVEHDRPTSALREISTSSDEDYRRILRELISTAYSEVLQIIDPAQDSQDRIVDFFRRYTPASQRKQMVTFFLGMCREAGIPVIDGAKAPTATANAGARSRKPRSSSADSGISRKQNQTNTRQHDQIPNTDQVSGTRVPPAFEGLMLSLPPAGEPMDQNQKKRWLSMAQLALDYLYPDARSSEVPHE